MIPWSPMAGGRLGWNEGSNRQPTDEYGKTLYNDFPDSDRLVIEAVGKVAGARGVPRARGRARPGTAEKGRDRADRLRLEGRTADGCRGDAVAELCAAPRHENLRNAKESLQG